MALNFPLNPTDGETFLGANGINYIFVAADGSWQVYSDPALVGIQVWSRDPGDAELIPIYNGDSVIVTNPQGSPAITLDSSGDVIATGKFVGKIDIDSYPELP